MAEKIDGLEIRIKAEGADAARPADAEGPAFEDDDPSTVPEGTGDTWGPPLRKPVPMKAGDARPGGAPARTVAEIIGCHCPEECDVHPSLQRAKKAEAENTALRAELQQRTKSLQDAVSDRIDISAERDALQQQVQALTNALRDMTEDLEARWDMNDPRTNPGIKANIERARSVLRAGLPATETGK